MFDDSPPPNHLLDVELLIDEIKKRPVLWDRLAVEYNDRVRKVKLWEEVHEAVFDDWKDLGSADKRIRAEEIKKKWRNLRDTYAKELANVRLAKKGKIRKKKPYRYKQRLSFLNTQFVDKEPKESSSESSDDDDSPKRKKTTNCTSSNIVIDVDTLIREVKNRPILWNRQSQLGERNERDLRENLWDEICENLFQNWADLGSTAKSLRAVEVKKKWRNLRDSFGRELGKQRKVELGIIKPKKPYRFFNELSFLHGNLEKRRDDDYSYNDMDNQQIEIEVASSNYSLSEFEDNFESEVKPAVAQKEEIIVKTYDEDVCFTEMLVPMLKKLNDEQKHYAQVKILNVLRRARMFDPLSNINDQRSSSVVMVKNENVNS